MAPATQARRALRLLWAALWRAQAVHLLIIVLLPAAAALVRAAVGMALLPVS